MSPITLIVKLLELVGSGTAFLPTHEVSTDKAQEPSSITVTPARRPVWPTCCG